MTYCKPHLIKLLICPVLAIGFFAQQASAAVTVTITSINGENPSTPNLTVSGPVQVAVQVNFDGYACGSQSMVGLRINAGVAVDTYQPIFTEGPGPWQWNGTLSWDPSDPNNYGLCVGKVNIDAVAAVYSGTTGVDCSSIQIVNGYSASYTVKVNNSGPGGCIACCAGTDDDGFGGGDGPGDGVGGG